MAKLKFNLDAGLNGSKVKQIIDTISNAITNGQLSIGEQLPSINALSKQLNISRDTVFKAYNELRRQNLVGSTPAKGYFVSGNKNKVLLILDYYSPFKDTLYKNFIQNLPEETITDLVFHHYNFDLFETIIKESLGKYSAYVVMNFDYNNMELSPILKSINKDKLVLIDIPVKSEEYSNIYQDFDRAFYNSLLEAKDRLSKYSCIQLVLPDKLEHPVVSRNAFIRFAKDHSFNHKVTNSREIGILKQNCYIVLRQGDMANVLKKCRNLGYEQGHDIGIIAYNDVPLYEFIGNGISVISTDFAQMGKKAAKAVMSKEIVNILIPSSFIRRGSV